jgi:hypothetical protein
MDTLSSFYRYHDNAHQLPNHWHLHALTNNHLPVGNITVIMPGNAMPWYGAVMQ